jgi:hypothetical protein
MLFGQQAAVKMALAVNNLPAEMLSEFGKCRLAGFDYLPGDDISINDMTAQGGEHGTDCALA